MVRDDFDSEEMYIEESEEDVSEREIALENDEITPEEEGFIRGSEEAAEVEDSDSDDSEEY